MSEVVLIILAILLFLAAYLLLTPLRIGVDLLFGERFSANSTVRIFPFRRSFALEKAIRERRLKKPQKKRKEEELEARKKKRKFDFSKLNSADRRLLWDTSGEALRFLGRVIKAPEYFVTADIAGGVAEPDMTGQIYGAYKAFNAVMPRAISVSYKPDFLAERFAGTVKAGLGVRIITIMKETVILLFRLRIVKLIKLYRKL